MYAISGSVGAWEKGADNKLEDVKTIQLMLQLAAEKLKNPALDPKGVDGIIGKPSKNSDTVKAIKAFQSRLTANPDGLIEVGKGTWKKLLAVVENTGAPAPNPNVYFPFPKLPSHDWTSSPRKFASNRSNGARAHAGCDLYFPKGTWIYAITDGKVIAGPYKFYAGTYAIEVDHGSFVARYGEVQMDSPVSKGDLVKAGKKIAKVGHLVDIDVPSDMLHLELYAGTATGALTVSAAHSKLRDDGVPFLRRKDLLDPTKYLNEWQKNLPAEN